jgi:hypothetical protein
LRGCVLPLDIDVDGGENGVAAVAVECGGAIKGATATADTVLWL